MRHDVKVAGTDVSPRRVSSCMRKSIASNNVTVCGCDLYMSLYSQLAVADKVVTQILRYFLPVHCTHQAKPRELQVNRSLTLGRSWCIM